MAHVLMEHRQGVPIDAEFTEATGFAERKTAIRLMKRNAQRTGCTLAADKAYDTRRSSQCRALAVPPHVAQNINRDGGSAIDARTTRQAATGPASVSASASRKPSAGARTHGPCARCGCAAFAAPASWRF